MRNAVLFLRRHLGERLSQLRHKKDRIIAEPIFPHRGKGNGSVAYALGRQHFAGGEHASDTAVKMGCAVGLPGQGREQQPIALGIAEPFAAIACRIHPRRAVERIHHQAGVIGNSRHPGGLHHSLGLEQCVFAKGCSGFLHFNVHPQIALEHQLYAKSRQNGAHFFHFSRIMRR